MKPVKATQAENINKVMAYVRKQNTTAGACAAATGVSRSGVWRAMQTLHGLKLVHIVAVDRQPEGRIPADIYAWGEGEDATESRIHRQNATVDQPLPIPYVELPFWHRHVFAPISTNAGHAPAGRI